MILVTLLFSGLAAFQQEKEEQQVYRFGVDVRTVYVDVFVTTGGEPVRGLAPEAFEVWDNGVLQEADLLDQGDMPLTSMLLIDISDSVVGDELNHLQAAAHAFMEGLDPGDEVGLMTFTHQIRLRKGLGTDVAELHRILDEPSAQGETSFHDALYTAVKLVEARAGRPFVLALTDGVDRTSWLTQSEVLTRIQASEAVVYAVGVKRRPLSALRISGRNMCQVAESAAGDFLRNITKQTGGRVWFLEHGANLEKILLSILTEMRNRYLLCYLPKEAPQDGWHTLEVRVKGYRSHEIRARPGYLVGSRK